MKRQLFVASAIIALVASGCSGSGSGIVPNTAGSQGTAARTAQVNLTVSRQMGTGCSSAKRGAQYISTNTGSIVVAITGMANQVIPLSSATHGCGSYTATFNAPVGNPSLTISTYQSTNGSGTPLSQATTSVAVSAGGPNSLSVVLDGVVAALALASSSSGLTQGTAANFTVTWSALDASGATIIGPGALVLSDGTTLPTPTITNDATGGITVGTYTPATYGGSWAVAYSGANTSTPIGFTAKATGVTSGNVDVPVSGATPADACNQPYAPQSVNDLSDEGAAFFSSVLPNASEICVSAWDFSSDLDTALIAAVHNGAHVVAIAPYSQRSSNSSDITSLTAAGVEVRNEYINTVPPAATNQSNIQAPFDIHAKFALVDGVAYLDGHNWFTSDVVMKDTNEADFNAMQNVLTTFSTPAPSNGTFTTDKQVSLQTEYQYLQSIAGSMDANSEIDWSAESYNPTSSASGETDYNQDVFAELCSIATSAAHPAMKFYVESYPYTAKAGTQIQLMTSLNANSGIFSSSSGLEKIALWRENGVVQSAWFGSSNATSTDLFDWGMVVHDSDLLAALKTWFDSGISGKTNKKGSGTADSTCLAPNV
jgi:hypothetical protein